MLPAQRRDMSEQFIQHLDTAAAQMSGGASLWVGTRLRPLLDND
jgi:hypothetical protein